MWRFKVSIVIGKGKYRKSMICFKDWEPIQAPRCLRPLVTFEPSSNCCPLLESLRTFLVSIFSVSSINVFGSFASLSFNLTTFTGATSLSSFDSRRSGRDLALTLLRLPATSGLRTRKNSRNLSNNYTCESLGFTAYSAVFRYAWLRFFRVPVESWPDWMTSRAAAAATCHCEDLNRRTRTTCPLRFVRFLQKCQSSIPLLYSAGAALRADHLHTGIWHASRQVLRPTSEDIRRLYTWWKWMETMEFCIASPRFWATRLLPPVTFCRARRHESEHVWSELTFFFDTTAGLLQRKEVDKKESSSKDWAIKQEHVKLQKKRLPKAFQAPCCSRHTG